MKPKILAIVPARAGSKRLPKKNVKLLDGLPLIAHTFEAIQKSKYIDVAVATSDCGEVLDISSKYSKVFALERPHELATDTTSMIDVVLHALEHSEQSDYFDIICLLQPTSPLRTHNDIDSAVELYLKNSAKNVVSFVKCQHSPLWATPLDSQDDYHSFLKNIKNTRSQDLQQFYQLNGAIYLIDKKEFLKAKTLFLTSDSHPLVMLPENSVDIDSLLDFRLAELILEDRKNGSNC